MQVIEKQSEGLKREFNVVVAAATIEDKVSARLTEVGQQVRLPGFRPGKVPMDLLRKRFGQSVRGEVLEKTIDESTQAALSEKAIRNHINSIFGKLGTPNRAQAIVRAREAGLGAASVARS